MNLFKKLAKDSLWLLIARVGAQGAMVVVTFVLARRMGASGFGEYAFMVTVVVVGNVITTFGSDMILIREIAARGDLSEVPSALVLQLVLSSAFIGGVFIFAPFLPGQSTDSLPALKIYSLSLIPLAFFTVFTSVLRGVQRMAAYAWVNLGVAVLQLSAVMIFIDPEAGVLDLACVLMGAQTAGTLLAGLWCVPLFPHLRNNWRFSMEGVLPHFMVCLPVALIAILGILHQKLSLALLSVIGTSAMAGLFSAAIRVMEAARFGHIAVFTALYPAMVDVRRAEAFRKTFRYSWFLLLAFSMVGSIFLFLLAGPIVDFFYGEEYMGSISSLKVLAFILIPFTVNSLISLTFLSRRREKTVLQILIVSLLILLMLNFWLIPIAGQLGAAWAVLFSESIQAFLYLWAWKVNFFRQTSLVSSKGVWHELSDLSG